MTYRPSAGSTLPVLGLWETIEREGGLAKAAENEAGGKEAIADFSGLIRVRMQRREY